MSTVVAGFCAYGGASGNNGTKPYGHLSENIVFKDNVFQRGTTPGENGLFRCGYYGAITDFDPTRPGNQWINNKWDDGTTLNSDGSTGGTTPPPPLPPTPTPTPPPPTPTPTPTPPSGGGTVTMGETSILVGDDSGNGNLLLAQSTTLSQTATI